MSLMTCTAHQKLFGDQIKDEMEGACSMYGGEKRCILSFGGETCRTETTWKAQAIWEDNIKINLQELGWGGGMDWIFLAQDRERWRALVNAVMNVRVP